ncbi:MAG: hypothetical protein ACKOF9_16170, partial [Burkholderiales bacterium]
MNNRLSRCLQVLWWPAERCLALPSKFLMVFTRLVLPTIAAAALFPWTGWPGAVAAALMVAYFQTAAAQQRKQRLTNILHTLEQAS